MGCWLLHPNWAGLSQGQGAGGSSQAPPASRVRCSPVRRAQDRAGHGSFPSLQGKLSPSLHCWACCAAAWGSLPGAFAAKPPSLIFLCWDMSLGSHISHSSALPAASPSHADQRGSHGWLGAVRWLRSPEAQHGTEPSSVGHVHVPLLAACKNLAPLARGRGGGFPAEIAPALGRRMLRPCQRFCWCEATAPEWRAGKCTHAEISVKA